tara:strand:- start:2570 stop:2911 length:342 start_codon:yes stop_codon:yes gene_type:complete
MNLIITFLAWTWLLGIALVVPTTLPAGGAQEALIQRRKNNVGSPIIALKDFNLLSSASNNSPVLTRVKAGTPVRVLRNWDSTDSGEWLLVDISIKDFNQFFYKRGWVNIGNSE